MKIGHICQVELRLADLGRATAFYGEAFDWRITPAGPGYTIADPGVEPLVGLIQRANDGVPVAATPYVLVEDLDGALERALGRGATLVVAKTEMPGQGWFCIMWDPWGNEIGIWQTLDGWHSVPSGSGHNGFMWMEVPAPTLEDGVGFYTAVFGWTFQVQPGTEHLAFVAGPGRAMGVGVITGPNGQPMRGITPYVRVDDVHAAVLKVAQAGGRITVQPEGGPGGGGKFAVFVDPDGIRMGLFEQAR